MLNCSIYRDIFYISQYFRYIAIFYASSLDFLLLHYQNNGNNGENDKLTKTNYSAVI